MVFTHKCALIFKDLRVNWAMRSGGCARDSSQTDRVDSNGNILSDVRA